MHALLGAVLALAGSAFASDPTRVLVVYNVNWPDQNGNGVGDSLEVAQWYAQRRGVPQANLLGLACSTGTGRSYSGQPGWERFWDEIRDPVMQKLQELGETQIDVLLFCYGMPEGLWGVGVNSPLFAIDDAMKIPYSIGSRSSPSLRFGAGNPYWEATPSIGEDLGRFNHILFRYRGQHMWLTARLDGKSPHAAIDLVEGALYGEAYLSPQPGYYQGTGYVDTRYGQYTATQLQAYPFGYGSYNVADMSMAFGQFFVTGGSWPLLWEATDQEIGEAGAVFTSGAPALSAADALWYGGWYNFRTYHDVWTWLPGSAACDLNSNSAENVRGGTGSFLAEALGRGLTCGTGAIAEPYLNGHPQPESFLHFMLSGYDFAEAAAACNPLVAWVNLAIGDPLYNPNAFRRTAILDTSAPPRPRLAVSGSGGTQRTIEVAIDPRGGSPEVVKAVVDYGTTPAYGASVASDTGHRIRHALDLGGLTPDSLYHFAATVTDPVAHATKSADWIFYTKDFAPALAGVNPPAQTVAAPALASLDLTLGHAQGIGSITGLQLLLTAPGLGVRDLDITVLLPVLFAPPLALGPGGDLVNARIVFPTTLGPGIYTLELRVFDASGTTVDTGTLTVR